MGGGSVSRPQGLESFYINPAGFAFDRGMYTVLSLVPAVYSEPKYAYQLINSLMSKKDPLSGVLLASKNMLSSSGAGVTLTAATGWTGRRWGAALMGYASGFFQGWPFPLGVEGSFNVAFTPAVGYAFPFYPADNVKLAAGFDVRPMTAFRVPVDGAVVDMIAGDPDAGRRIIQDGLTDPYFTVLFDAGFQAVFWDHLAVGLSVRDMGPPYSSPGTGRPPVKNPFSVNAGISYSGEFNLLFFRFAPILTVDMTNINGFILGQADFWETFHAGAELGIWDVIYLRAGLNQGYLSAGAAVEIPFVSLSFSYYTVEAGEYLGDKPLTSFQMELLLRIK